jgi:hypothetical protein
VPPIIERARGQYLGEIPVVRGLSRSGRQQGVFGGVAAVLRRGFDFLGKLRTDKLLCFIAEGG